LAFSLDGKNLGPVSLSGLLHALDYPRCSALTNAETVVIAGPKLGQMVAESWQGGTCIATMRRWENDSGKTEFYQIDKGFVRLPLHTETSATPIPVLFSQYEAAYYIRKGADGSLIVYERDVNCGYIFFVPFKKDFSQWCHFPPVPPAN
jgi:hypothetical protein